MKFKKQLFFGVALALSVGGITPFIISCSNTSDIVQPTPNIATSYSWLTKAIKEVPNRLAGDTNNTTQLYNEQKGEKYALDWITKQLETMNYKNNPENNPSRNIAPAIDANQSHNDTVKRVVTWALTPSQVNQDLDFDGFFKQNFTWYTAPPNVTNASTNLVLNINSLDKSMNTPGDGSKKDLYIVSHYDTKNPKNQGVNDNSSGLATNLAIADHFKLTANREKLNYDIKLVFASAEEVGIKGTWAFVNQYLIPTTITNTLGAINLDSVAGGDYVYAHSPNSGSGIAGANANPQLRDQLYNLSQNNFLIHPQVTAKSPKKGESGDFSDHVPFYQKGILSAYIESTNFNINATDYDGYSQTTNPEYWKNADGTIAALTKKTVTAVSGGVIEIFEPDANTPTTNNWGKIWHTDLDTMENFDKNFPGRILQQMENVFKVLIKYLME